MRLVFKYVSSVALLLSASEAAAAVADPTGDFLASFTGTPSGDLDIVSAEVAFNGTSLAFSEAMNGAVGSTPGSLFVWAIDRGSGITRPALAPPAGAGFLWDAVVVMFPDGTLRVVTFSGLPTTIVGGTSVMGNSLSATVPISLLPSTGFAPADYTFSLWSRARVNPAADGSNSEVADLLAGSGSLRAAAVPEPATWLTMLLGFTFIGGTMRRRGRRVQLA